MLSSLSLTPQPGTDKHTLFDGLRPLDCSVVLVQYNVIRIYIQKKKLNHYRLQKFFQALRRSKLEN